jgi:osmotically-inducible protein OsmY
MNLRKSLAVFLFGGVIVGTLVASKAEDAEILANVGRTAAEKVRGGMPDARRVAGPLAAFRAGDALPVEERVRVRIQTDKAMAGTEVLVVATPAAGEVRLKGFVKDAGQRTRALELANGTSGVTNVLNDLAVPE